MNQEGIFLWDLTFTLGDCFVKVIVTATHFFIDDLASHLWKIPYPILFFLLSYRDFGSVCSLIKQTLD